MSVQGTDEKEPLITTDHLVGQVLDERYEVLEVIGEGGMGRVYRGRHVLSGGEVAIKVLRSAVLKVNGVLERVEREARAASAIGDPHIVDVRDFGKLPSGEPYMVMEHLDGTELALEVWEQGRIETARACAIADQLAQALGAAHARGIVHRDLKTENVLLVRRPSREDFVKLVDFGVAHVQSESAKITRAGEVLGTPQYMSPEQISGAGVDLRTDVYAFGVLLYEMLTGTLPFDSDDLRQLCLLHLTVSPRPPTELAASIPAELEAIILRCLAKAPEDRFASMAQIQDALATVPGYTPQRRRTAVDIASTMPLRGTQPVRPTVIAQAVDPRPRRLALAAALVLGLVTAGGGTFLWMEGPEQAAAANAPETADAAPRSAGATPELAPEPTVQVTVDPPTSEPEPALEAATPSRIALSSVDGAVVRRGDEVLGSVPLELDRPADDERVALTLERDGYRTRQVVLSAFTADELDVPLEATPVRRAARPAPTSRPAPTAHASAELPSVELPPASPQPASPQPVSPQLQPASPRTQVATASAPALATSRARPFLDPWN